MTPDTATRPGLEPAASLTSVRVKRRRPGTSTVGKRGDLTAEAEPEVIFAPPPAREPEPAAPELLLLPAAFEPPREPGPPLAELLLLPPASEPPREPEPPPAELLLLPPASEPPREPELPLTELLPIPEPPPAVLAPEAEADAAAEAAEAHAEPEAGELDILDYWDSLRGARPVPAIEDLDRAYVAGTWPNTLLLAVEQTELPRITRLGENNGEIDYTGMVIDWIMTRGRQSARHGEPMEEEQRFAVASGSARYRLLLLPMTGEGPGCGHVLCQLARLEERGAAAGWRRWLTG